MQGETVGEPLQSIMCEYSRARCFHETEPAGGVAGLVGREKKFSGVFTTDGSSH